MSDLETKLSTYLMQVAKDHPSYEPIVLRVRLVKDDTPGATAWINPKCQIGYNPNFFKTLKDKEQYAVILHEVYHYAYSHFLRFSLLYKIHGKINMMLANIAADLEINSFIPDMPIAAVFAHKFRFPPGLTLEEYYAKLLERPDLVSGGHMSDIQIDDIEDISQEDQQTIEEVLVEVESKGRSLSKGSGKGSVKIIKTKPINIHSYIKSLYSKLLTKVSYGFSDTDYSKLRHNTLPGVLRFKKVELSAPISLVFIVDVSGSRSDSMINRSMSRILSTVKDIAEDDPIIDMIIIDTEVTDYIRINSAKDLPKSYKGRGGTTMAPAYSAFKMKYDLAIIMTDGYIDWEDLNYIPEYYKKRTVIGLDKNRFNPFLVSEFPVFIQ